MCVCVCVCVCVRVCVCVCVRERERDRERVCALKRNIFTNFKKSREIIGEVRLTAGLICEIYMYSMAHG